MNRNWRATVEEAAKKGRLYDLLKATPQGTWHIRGVQGKTLLCTTLPWPWSSPTSRCGKGEKEPLNQGVLRGSMLDSSYFKRECSEGRIDFEFLENECLWGRMTELLQIIPKEHWSWRNEHIYAGDAEHWTLLHYACMGKNGDAVTALLEHGLDKEARSLRKKETPIITAVRFHSPPALQLLISAAADVNVVNYKGEGVWDVLLSAFRSELKFRESFFVDDVDDFTACARVLLCTGIKPTSNQKGIYGYPAEIAAIERGIDHCRMATVAFLRVKRAGGLWRWDKFLLAHIARHVWATRSEEWAE